MNQQFFITVGREFLRDALKIFFEAHIADIVKKFELGCPDLKKYVSQLMNHFLELNNIKHWYDPSHSPTFPDDLFKYASDASGRALLVMVFNHAIKYGDIDCMPQGFRDNFLCQ